MDHSFNDRVDQVFGSISSSFSSTPWSLTDAQVEKRAWNRDKTDNRDNDDETLVSSSFDNLFNSRRNRRKRLNEDEDEDEDEEDGDVGDDESSDGDEWDIRSSIGLDSTLDNEEEEDAYDKMAEGRENGGERLYMKDVTDHGAYLNSHNVLPISDAKKDPVAKTRLKEDEDEPIPMLNCMTTSVAGYGMRIKSILKRKNDNDAVKPAKRVRFDPNCKNDDELRNSIQPQPQPQPQPQGFGNGPSVPDYVVNPSKYTRYELSHEEEEEEGVQSKDIGVEEKKSFPSRSWLLFIPRKKRRNDDGAAAKHPSTKGIAIAALEVVQEHEAEAEAELRQEMQDCSKKPGRRYRSRMEQDDAAAA